MVADLKVFEVFSVGRSLFKSQKLEGARLNLGGVDAAMNFDDELVQEERVCSGESSGPRRFFILDGSFGFRAKCTDDEEK